ncbi:MAG: hypothetical protein AAF493_07490 [Pseudomonadota bacterium]
MNSFEVVVQRAKAVGLVVRGGFHPGPDDGVPAIGSADPKSLVLLGNGGSSLWKTFSAWRETFTDPDPLDAWSHEVVTELAAGLGGFALFPFGGPPFLPFLRWATRAETLYQSPIGLMLHPQFGLWHAYRGAIALPYRVTFDAPDAQASSPCNNCPDQPCLTTCPVNAMHDGRYDVPTCVGHLGGDPASACMEGGCLARRACPVGAHYTYEPEHAAFHMRAFLNGQSGRGHKPESR